MKNYLVSRLAKNFGRAEDNSFINGIGSNMPTGLLADDGGADIGVTSDSITYDDVVKLFFSVESDHAREHLYDKVKRILLNDQAEKESANSITV